MGTSCTDSLRRVAVTTTSSIPEVAAASVAVSAYADAAQLLSTAAIAQASFWLFCKKISQQASWPRPRKNEYAFQRLLQAKEIPCDLLRRTHPCAASPLPRMAFYARHIAG